MKRILLLCYISMFLVAFSSAQTKIVERSAKKAPEWVGGVADGFLIVSVDGKTLAEAQNNALTEITERIIQSIASNVTVMQQSEMSEINTDGRIESKDAYSRSSKIIAAKLPFLKGISLSNAIDSYWIKVQHRKTRETHYELSVKYPYSYSQQQSLIAQFEEYDTQKESQYQTLRNNIDNIEAVDEIQHAIAELESLSEYFFDEVRLQQVNGLITQYKLLYNDISLTGSFVDSGKYHLQVLLQGHPIKVTTRPTVTANCASQIEIQPADGSFMVAYSSEDCLPEEENYLLFTLRIGGKKHEHRAYIKDIADRKISNLSVSTEGRLILSTDSVDVNNRTISGINIRMTLNNRSGNPFGLKAIELHIPEISSPIILDNINNAYSSKGIIQVSAKAEGIFSIRDKKTSSYSFVQGTITLVDNSGTIIRQRLSLPYTTNWE